MLYLDSNNHIKVTDLKNASTGVAIAEGVVSVTVYDDKEVALQGAEWPLSMQPVDGQSGSYEVTLPSELNLKMLGNYKVEIVAQSEGLKLTMVKHTKARIYTG